MATVHDPWQERLGNSHMIQHVNIDLPVMEPHMSWDSISGGRRLNALKVKTTNGNGAVPARKLHPSTGQRVTDSEKLNAISSGRNENDSTLVAAKLTSNLSHQKPMTEQRDGAQKLSRSESGRLESVGSLNEANQIDPVMRPNSSGSSKSENSRRRDSSNRLDSAGRPDSSGYISGASVTSTPDRPSSALARGVKITEFKENKVNPEPVVMEDTDLLMEDHLSTRKLRALTGQQNLERVDYLEIKVNTRETSLGNFGSHLPNLSQLKLSNSTILSIRDLGSSLHNVTVLWMARCGLEDLDGLSSLNNLRELYLCYNEIYDISPCSMLEHIKILDLEGNNIEELSQVEFLALCSSLTHLTLDGNPMCMTPSPDEASPDYDYRRAVKSIIPHLQNLDDQPLLAGDSGKHRFVFQDDWLLIEELRAAGNIISAEDNPDLNVPGFRPGTAVRPTTGYRPGTALKQQINRPYTRSGLCRPSSSMLRPGSSAGRPGSSMGRPSSSRPGTARPGSGGVRPGSAQDEENDIEDLSDLTLGGVVCGNPSKALRMRSRTRKESPVKERTADPIYDPSTLEEDPQLSGLMSEVNAWKKEHQKTRDQIEAERAPQILKIDHDDAVSLSGDDESLNSDSDDDLSSGYHSNRSRQLQSVTSLSSSWQHSGGSPCSSASHRPRRLQHDESFEARDDSSPIAMSADLSGHERLLDQTAGALHKRDRFDSKPPLQQIRSFDKTSPTIRSPESPVTTPPGIQKALGLSSRMRKTNLTNVPLLPSKPAQFK